MILIVFTTKLYHTKNYQGTITYNKRARGNFKIIPYQELSGNYNTEDARPLAGRIIPYQELSGNYNGCKLIFFFVTIIPYQELSGNYNCSAELPR